VDGVTAGGGGGEGGWQLPSCGIEDLGAAVTDCTWVLFVLHCCGRYANGLTTICLYSSLLIVCLLLLLLFSVGRRKQRLR